MIETPVLVSILVWMSGLASLLAFVTYFYVLWSKPHWIRLVNGSGLFFTALALMQLAVLLPRAASHGTLFIMATVVALLNAAVLAQSFSALRNRQAWDGMERRQPDSEAPSTPGTIKQAP